MTTHERHPAIVAAGAAHRVRALMSRDTGATWSRSRLAQMMTPRQKDGLDAALVDLEAAGDVVRTHGPRGGDLFTPSEGLCVTLANVARAEALAEVEAWRVALEAVTERRDALAADLDGRWGTYAEDVALAEAEALVEGRAWRLAQAVAAVPPRLTAADLLAQTEAQAVAEDQGRRAEHHAARRVEGLATDLEPIRQAMAEAGGDPAALAAVVEWAGALAGDAEKAGADDIAGAALLLAHRAGAALDLLTTTSTAPAAEAPTVTLEGRHAPHDLDPAPRADGPSPRPAHGAPGPVLVWPDALRRGVARARRRPALDLVGAGGPDGGHAPRR